MSRFKLIWVVGPPPANISISENQKVCIVAAVPPRQEGRMHRHERGAGCGGRFGDARRAALEADGEVVWSWRPDAGAKFSWDAIPRRRRGQKSPVPGESAKYAVKTIAQGRPDDPAPPVVLPRATFYARGPRVRAEHPVFPAPSYSEGQFSSIARAHCVARSRTRALQAMKALFEIFGRLSCCGDESALPLPRSCGGRLGWGCFRKLRWSRG